MAWTAAANNLLTEAEAKSVVGVQGTSDEDRLAVVVTAVSDRLEDLCGPIVRRSVADERHDGGAETVWLANAPALISSLVVVEYDGTTSTTLTAEAAGTVPASGYYPHPFGDGTLALRLRRRSGGRDARFAAGRGNVVVSYAAGRVADTASVPTRFKQAAALTLKAMWRADRPDVGNVGDFDTPFNNFPTFAVPRAVVELLRDDVIEQIPGA